MGDIQALLVETTGTEQEKRYVVVVCKQGVQTRHFGDSDAHKFRRQAELTRAWVPIGG